MTISLKIEARGKFRLTFTGKHNDAKFVSKFCQTLFEDIILMTNPKDAMFGEFNDQGKPCIDAYGEMFDNTSDCKEELKDAVRGLKKAFKEMEE